MNILVIRTDNIGDLVCTTPLLTALRERYPKAWIGVLANAYSAPVLRGHPAVDAVFAYRKVKHLAPGESTLAAYWARLRTVLALRAKRLDWVLVPAVSGQKSALRFARWLGGGQVVVNADIGRVHEVEKVYAIERLLPDGLSWPPPPLSLTVDAEIAAKTVATLPATVRQGDGPLVALHLSARKPQQRWPVERFAELARRLHAASAARFLLFWSPGDEDHPQHPGDDGKAAALQGLLVGLPVAPVPTAALPELVAGLSLADCVVLSDGGALHIAAALGKPSVCFFGNSPAERWRPWRAPHCVLRNAEEDVAKISVDEVFEAFFSLRG